MSDDVDHSYQGEGIKAKFRSCLLMILSADGMSKESRVTAVSALVDFYSETSIYLASERYIAGLVQDLLDVKRKI